MGLGGPKGNQKARKLTTDELKKEAYRQFCDHVSNGNPVESWYFEHPDITICYKTMMNYIKESPSEFPPINKQVAIAKSLRKWFKKGEDMMSSQKKCNPAIYQMIMRNIHGWDKETQEEKNDRAKKEMTALEVLVSEIRKKPNE